MTSSPTSTPGPRRRWPFALAVAAVVLAVVVLVWLLVVRALLGDDAGSGAGATASASPVASGPSEPSPTTAGPVSPGPTEAGEPASPGPSTPSTEPSEAPGAPTGPVEPLTVWFIGEHEDTQQNPALYPETVLVPVPQGRTQVQAAVDALLSTRPTDPDYANAFVAGDGGAAGGGPLTATVTGDASGTVVDLPAAAFGTGVGSAYAELGVQQVVSTVLSNGAPGPVTVTVDGETGAEVWGVIVLEPAYEADEQVRASASITSLVDGATTSTPVTVAGVGFGFEGELDVLVLDEESGATVEQTFVAVSGGAELDDDGRPVRSPYETDLDLDPGTYRVVVADANEADEGPRWTSYDDKVVTVE